VDSNKYKSRNGPRSESHNVLPQVEADLRSNLKIVQSKFVFGDELSIADDDHGGDPYNSTGAYCIIKAKDIAGE
jgi:glutathione S-transferase